MTGRRLAAAAAITMPQILRQVGASGTESAIVFHNPAAVPYCPKPQASR
jgi:hypothetical protein